MVKLFYRLGALCIIGSFLSFVLFAMQVISLAVALICFASALVSGLLFAAIGKVLDYLSSIADRLERIGTALLKEEPEGEEQ